MSDPRRNKAVLTIAGSDPSGGAGIQADLKTFAVLGVYGAAAITCLTAQSTLGVHSILPVAPEMVQRQIALVLADLPVTHIKIGMVGTAGIAGAIGSALAGFTGEVIYDPVLKSTTGSDLLEPAALDRVREEVIGRATVLTPNLPELQALTGISRNGPQDIIDAGKRLFADFPTLRAIAVKGGHAPAPRDQTVDYLLLPSDCLPVSHKWLRTTNTHGTGCTFASAFSAFHLLTGSYRQAFTRTAKFLNDLLKISEGFRLGHGTGPLLHHLIVR